MLSDIALKSSKQIIEEYRFLNTISNNATNLMTSVIKSVGGNISSDHIDASYIKSSHGSEETFSRRQQLTKPPLIIAS